MSEYLANLRARAIKRIRQFPELDKWLLLRRQRAAANYGGYPDWDKILSDRAAWERLLQEAKSGQRILIATGVGSHLAAAQMETTLAVALSLRSARVHALLCDAILPACQMCEPRVFPDVRRFAAYGPKRDLCGHCYAPARNAYEAIGVPVKSYSEYLSPADLACVDRIASSTAEDEMSSFELDGIRIGEHAKAGTLRFFARATLECEPLAGQVMKRYFRAALITAKSARNMFEREGYDAAVFHHGIYVPQGIIGEVARKLGVRVVNWNIAYRKNCFIFSHGDTYHHTLMNEDTAAWESMDWTPQREEAITKYLRSRWKGENDWIRFHENPFFEKERIVAEIGCDSSRPIIGCLTNVMWDAQLHYRANAFRNMLEWLVFTVKYFANRKDLQLVIRVHPAEIRGSVPSRQPVVQELKMRFPTLPDNVFVVGPESSVSTYALAELCDSVLIYGTKTGVELTSMGIPVIVAGEAWIRNKGVTLDATSPEHYATILQTLPARSRLPAEIMERARKYAYHFFFRRMIPVEVFEDANGIPPFKLAPVKAALLARDGDPGIQQICSGILDGAPFIFEPGLARR